MSAPNQLSFLPEDYLETKRQRRTNVICAALFLLIMAGIGTAFSVMEKSLRQAEKDNAEAVKQYAEAASRIEQERTPGRFAASGVGAITCACQSSHLPSVSGSVASSPTTRR